MVSSGIRLAVFLVSTTYVVGAGLTVLPLRLAFPRSFLLQSACGLSLSLIVCLLPRPWAGALLLILVITGAAALWSGRSQRSVTRPGAGVVWVAGILPGAALAVVALSVGPFRDVSFSSGGDLIYRTGSRVASRTAGPSGVLTEVALVEARTFRSGNPFVSGVPLVRFDPRREYLSLAQSFSGVDRFLLLGSIVPALSILAALAAGASVVRRAEGFWAPVLFGCLLFGSGLGYLAGVLPLIRSWKFRIWPYLTESTDLTELLSAPETPLLLFLLLASVASLRPLSSETTTDASSRPGAWILVVAAAFTEPRLVPALLAALCLLHVSRDFRAKAPWRRPGLSLALLTTALVASFMLSPTPFEPLQPLRRALSYARLETIAAIVNRALAEGAIEDVVRTAFYLSLFVTAALGIRALVLPALWRQLRRSGATWELWGASLTLGCLVVGLAGAAPIAWSLGLLLLWVFVAMEVAARVEKSRGMRQVAVLGAAALLAYPSSVNFLRHYHHSPTERLPASDVALGQRLFALAAPTDPVLHRPNRESLSLASHVALRPSVLCYFGRGGDADFAELEERSEDVRAFFSTTDPPEALAIATKYGARWVVVDKNRPLEFPIPNWLQPMAVSESYRLYEIETSNVASDGAL